MSRNQDKIRRAVKAKGWEVIELSWDPIGPAIEMCGPDGGWFLMVEYNGEKYNYETILAYNIKEVLEQIENLPQMPVKEVAQ